MVDWVVLTAAIVLLGFILSISIMENSSGYLMDEFATMNQQYAKSGVDVSQLDTPTQTQTPTPTAKRAPINN